VTACGERGCRARRRFLPVIGAGFMYGTTTGFTYGSLTAATGERVYAGTVVSPSPMRYTSVDLDAGDRLSLSPDGRSLTFVFNNLGRSDGVDFVTDWQARVGLLVQNWAHQRTPSARHTTPAHYPTPGRPALRRHRPSH
jgi:hypothetical protein